MAVDLADMAGETGAHVVQFYEHESELAQSVKRYLTVAIEDGGIGIMIATEPHRRLIEAALEAGQIDPARQYRCGNLIFLDAVQVLAGFVRDGQVDDAGFRRVVGSVLREAAATGKPVRAYGEMVALLWEAGDVLAAIELEKSWNSLSRELPFALMCGYRSESVRGEEQAEALAQVCQLHSSVVPATAGRAPDSEPAGISARFPAEKGMPRSARQFVADALWRWGRTAGLVDDAALVVTELATNAVVHARSSFSVALRPQGAGVHLSVRDASPARPILRDDSPSATSGRGLRLIAALASDWGVELEADGKTVWALLHP